MYACTHRLFIVMNFLVSSSKICGLTVFDLCNKSFCFCEVDSLYAYVKTVLVGWLFWTNQSVLR